MLDSTKWTSTNGRVIPISDMATPHIENAIAKIERSEGWRKNYLWRLKLELNIRTQEGVL